MRPRFGEHLDGWLISGILGSMSYHDGSPDTLPWRQVHAAYADPGATAQETWRLILAATPEYPARLAGPAVTRTLAILLTTPADPRDPFEPGALADLAVLKRQTTKIILEDGLVSFWWYLAEIALHRAVLHGALRETVSAARAHLFLRELVRAAADYLVGRDLTYLLPSGTGLLPGVEAAARRRESLVAAATDSVERLLFGPTPLSDWSALIQAAWAA